MPVSNLNSENYIMESHNLQQLLDRGATYLQVSLIATDFSYRILATDNISPIRSNLNLISDMGFLSADFFVNSSDTFDNVCQLSGFNFSGSTQCTSIRRDRQIIGYLYALNFGVNVISLNIELKWIANLASIIIFRDYVYDIHVVTPEQFFLSTLLSQNNPVDPDLISKQQNKLNISFQKHIYVMTIHIVGGIPGKLSTSINSLKKELTASLQKTYGFIYKENLVYLFSRDSVNSSLGVFLTDTINVLIKYNMVCGVSTNFGSLCEIQKAYSQAITAIELGKKMNGRKPLYLYDDYSFYHMLAICSKHENVINFCHPVVRGLLYYDQSHKTDHLKTLYMYFMNGMNTTKTAEAMNIHVNTIKYRLAQIKRELGSDLTDGRDVQPIQRSLDILRYLGYISLN